MPLQIIEYGNGLDGIDEYIPDFQLRNTAATLPGLNDLLIAPKTIWPTFLEFDEGIDKLLYPIRTNNNIYTVYDYTNQHNPGLHGKILNNSKDYYEDKEDRTKAFIARFKDKTNIIVGLNGKTPFAVEKREVNEGNNELIWKIAFNKSPSDKSKINNGDGTVLFQSSYLKGLPKEKYFAYIPKKIQDSHSELMDNIDIINGLKDIINDKTPSKLSGFNDFFPKIDWSSDTNSNINFEENLTYEERNKIRSFIPKRQWNKNLNPNNDAETFCLTRRAAINVLNGANLKEEAKHINQNEEFLYNHIKKMLFPML